jgi:LacI family transcriptional regulator
MYLSETDYTLTLLIAAENDAEKTRSYLQAGNVDGAIILSHHSDDRSYIALARSIPVVFGGRPMSAEGVGAYYVDVDNVLAAQQVTERLITQGRQRIATIAGPQNMAAGLDRLEGWQIALNTVGQATDLIEYGDFSPASGAEAMTRLLDRGVAFDGVFVANSLMASGALSVLRDRGLRVPTDVGMVTFDNDFFTQSAQPPLTTVEQPTVDVGREMADVLLRLIDGQRVHTVTMLPTTLIDRDSA